jgi:hypothetical protein
VADKLVPVTDYKVKDEGPFRAIFKFSDFSLDIEIGHNFTPSLHFLLLFPLKMVEPISSIFALIHLVNTLARIFKKVYTWLKARSDPLWRENNRMLKLLKAYFERHEYSSWYQELLNAPWMADNSFSLGPGALGTAHD